MVTSLFFIFMCSSRYSFATHYVLTMMMVAVADSEGVAAHLRVLINQIVAVSQNAGLYISKMMFQIAG